MIVGSNQPSLGPIENGTTYIVRPLHLHFTETAFDKAHADVFDG
jgi:hypothetical protein